MRWMFTHSPTSSATLDGLSYKNLIRRRSVKYKFVTVIWTILWFVALVMAFRFSFYTRYNYSATAVNSGSTSTQKPEPQVLASFNTAEGLPSADEVFDIVNINRTANNIKPLVRNATLTKLAQDRANDMVKRNYYAHKNPDGFMFYDLLDQQNYATGFACENLDLSFVNNPVQYVKDWADSTHGHRECMLSDQVTDAGYAVVTYSTSSESQDFTSYLIVAIHAEVN